MLASRCRTLSSNGDVTAAAMRMMELGRGTGMLQCRAEGLSTLPVVSVSQLPSTQQDRLSAGVCLAAMRAARRPLCAIQHPTPGKPQELSEHVTEALLRGAQAARRCPSRWARPPRTAPHLR